MPEITIAICTWNRAGELRKTLEAVRDLEGLREADLEVLVVDNGSTDQTRAVLDRFGGLPLRVEGEARLGIGHARNRVRECARGDLILWTDDDASPDPGWLEAYRQAAARHPGAAYFGGPVRPAFARAAPSWLERGFPEISGCFSCLDLGPEPRALGPAETLYGLNMAIRANALRAHSYEGNLGHVGDRLWLGEDSLFVENLKASGAKGRWVPAAQVIHRIPEARMTLRYVRAYYHTLGRVAALSRRGGMLNRVPGCIVRGVDHWLGYHVKRAIGKPPPVWLYHLRRAHIKWGRAWGLLVPDRKPGRASLMPRRREHGGAMRRVGWQDRAPDDGPR